MLVLSGVAISCAPALLINTPLDEGTIEVWRDNMDACRTKTTPYFRVSKANKRYAIWKIVDRTNCTREYDVEIKFDKKASDPVPSCNKRGRSRIQCDVRSSTDGLYDYSVWIGTAKEDPEMDIAQ
jgi:hypothetical protein